MSLDWVLLAVGIGVIGHAVRTILRERDFARTARGTTAIVTGLRYRGDGNSSYRTHPILRFDLDDGRSVETEAYLGEYYSDVEEGQQVSVRYDPADPSRARTEPIGGWTMSVWGIQILVGVFAMLFGLRGLL